MSTTIQIPFTAEDRRACAEIMDRVPGYSGELHYAFFMSLFALNQFDRMLMLGVYNGRDLCFCLSILHRHHPNRKMSIIGVDKFSDDECADWHPSRKGMTWEQAGYGVPPSIEAAQKNISALPNHGIVELVKSDDAEFLANTTMRFPCIYYDTSHDEGTIERQIHQSPRILEAPAIMCGDDFTDAGNWGVKRVVTRSFSQYNVFAGYIWRSALIFLKRQMPDVIPAEVTFTEAQV